jgi:ATP-dependent DNA helicase RecQ
LAESKDEFPVLKLTEESKLILFKNKKVELQKVKELAKAVTVNEIETQYPETELSHNSELFDKLRNIRREQAEKENVPPYVIFSDATLMELATYLPQTKEELNEISGFGTFKIEKYGELFLSVIVEFCEQNNLSSLIFNKKPKKKTRAKNSQ